MGLARIGTSTQLIVSGPLSAFANEIEMGEPLHSLILCGEMHDIEEKMYKHFYYDCQATHEENKE